MEIDLATYIQILQAGTFTGWGLLLFFYMAAGPWMIAYGKAMIQRAKVFIEYDKTKEYRPFASNLIPNLRSAIKLPGDRGILGVRRESAGHSSKIQTFLFSSEFEYTISPQEANGERWMAVDETNEDAVVYGYVFNERLQRITKEEYESKKHATAKMWVKYPSATISPEEFVKYQQINADPLLTEGYAQHKENALREKINNPMAMMIGQYGWFIIALIIVGALAYNWLSQNNAAITAQQSLDTCKQQMIDLYNSGVCQSKPNINASAILTGGKVK